MRKFVGLICWITVLTLVFAGCDNSVENDVKKATWNQLSKQEQKHTVGNWKKATVKKYILLTSNQTTMKQ
ncbi:hypothetical protein OCE25_29440 [Bacillus cereus]|nr:hypothetical protein [Bacillus cereus]